MTTAESPLHKIKCAEGSGITPALVFPLLSRCLVLAIESFSSECVTPGIFGAGGLRNDLARTDTCRPCHRENAVCAIPVPLLRLPQNRFRSAKGIQERCKLNYVEAYDFITSFGVSGACIPRLQARSLARNGSGCRSPLEWR